MWIEEIDCRGGDEIDEDLTILAHGDVFDPGWEWEFVDCVGVGRMVCMRS